MNNNKITNLTDPTSNQDAATKAYVDAQIVASGDITSVVAGTGLSGGGTSGDVTLNIDGTVATLTGSQTLTNKTIDLTDNTLSGTFAELNTAITGDEVVGRDTTDTLTNKTLTSPAIDTITRTGSFTLDVSDYIILDADGGEVFLRDGTAGNYGSLIRNGANDLTIASGSSQALIFTGANAAFQGNVSVSGTLNSHTIPGGTGTIALTSTVQGLSLIHI